MFSVNYTKTGSHFSLITNSLSEPSLKKKKNPIKEIAKNVSVYKMMITMLTINCRNTEIKKKI